MHPGTQTVSTETLLRAVADPDRREILKLLRTMDDEDVTVEQLAEAFGSRRPPNDSRIQRTRTAIELRHTHLPTLAEAELIAYDRVQETVIYRGDERAEALLGFITERLE